LGGAVHPVLDHSLDKRSAALSGGLQRVDLAVSGDTAKHIKLAFERATHHGAVLLFDEADSLLSKRVNYLSKGIQGSSARR